MERDNRQNALNQLVVIAASNGYVTFDDIMRCADDNSLSIGEFDWLAETAESRNIIIYDEAPKPIVSGDDDYDDYAQIDYERTFAEAVEMAPEIETLIETVRSIMPPQRGEVGRLKYQIKEGNVHARERMIEMYLRIAIRIAVARAKEYNIDLEETISDAFIGLIIAVDKYDPDFSGHSFLLHRSGFTRIFPESRALAIPIFIFPFIVKNGFLPCIHFLRRMVARIAIKFSSVRK